jgi:hypothetical protein
MAQNANILIVEDEAVFVMSLEKHETGGFEQSRNKPHSH